MMVIKYNYFILGDHQDLVVYRICQVLHCHHL